MNDSAIFSALFLLAAGLILYRLRGIRRDNRSARTVDRGSEYAQAEAELGPYAANIQPQVYTHYALGILHAYLLYRPI